MRRTTTATLDLVIVYDEYIIQPETLLFYFNRNGKEYKINTIAVFCTRRLTRSQLFFFLVEKKMHLNTKGNLKSMTESLISPSKGYENNNQSWCHETTTIIRIASISFSLFARVFSTIKNVSLRRFYSTA